MHACLNSFLARSVSFLSLIVVCTAVLVPASPAQGQLSGVAQAMEPEFFTRDLLIFIEGLDLDETQSVIAEAIFDDYEQQFDLGKAQMEMEIEEMEAEIDASSKAEEAAKDIEVPIEAPGTEGAPASPANWQPGGRISEGLGDIEGA